MKPLRIIVLAASLVLIALPPDSFASDSTQGKPAQGKPEAPHRGWGSLPPEA